MTKTTFTESEKMQLIGLKTVALSLWKQIEACEKAAGEIIEGRNRAGDWLLDNNSDFDKLIEWLEYDKQRDIIEQVERDI